MHGNSRSKLWVDFPPLQAVQGWTCTSDKWPTGQELSSAEGRGQGPGTDPGLMPLCCELCGFQFQRKQIVRRWCRNGGSGDDNDEITDWLWSFYCLHCFKFCGNHIFVNVDNKEVKWKNVLQNVAMGLAIFFILWWLHQTSGGSGKFISSLLQNL